MSWPKEPFEHWWSRTRKQFPAELLPVSTGDAPVTITATACAADGWTPLKAPPDPRQGHVAVWTGTEMIVWGGYQINTPPYFNSGSRYDPATDDWSATTLSGAPPPGPTPPGAVWTGSEMIVWSGNPAVPGGRYNPVTDSWTPTTLTSAPAIRYNFTTAWTGSEMIVWGGRDPSLNDLNTGARYNPSSDTWTATNTTGAPAGRRLHSAVWTGSEMIVWGGAGIGNMSLNTGGRYSPGTDSWVSTTTTGAPIPRYGQPAVWTGQKMIIWGGQDNGGSPINSGGRYDASTDSWAPTNTANAPTARFAHTSIWSGTEMIVWGGNSLFGGVLDTGGRYDPAGDTWTATATASAPTARQQHTAVWTGSEMIVWGGFDGFLTVFDTGGRYDPSTNSWIPTNTYGAPAARDGHTAIWTGSEMIVWGGFGYSNVSNILLNSGGRYDPAVDSWSAVTLTNAPSARITHSAVWTGNGMIIWGGSDGNTLNTGAIYSPSLDSWTAVTTLNAPAIREYHTAVWTGSQMIVWGGFTACGPCTLNDGGKYDPVSNTWTALSTTNAPLPRGRQSAVWTGTEMIVWGGERDAMPLNTGGRYNPATDTWIRISTTNVPPGLTLHAAVWTGNEMIVWGGTGGRYNPTTDSWLGTSTVDAPAASQYHTGIWSGDEMIIWGGVDLAANKLNTGGRFDPVTNTWIPTDVSTAPTARSQHTAVWTGNQMIVWGGAPVTRSGGIYCTSTCAGVFNLDRNVYSCSDNATVHLADTDLVGAGSQSVQAWSNTEPAPENITLTETPTLSGLFDGSLIIDPGTPANGDGKISVTDGDVITVQYTDASTCGIPNQISQKTVSIDCSSPSITNVQVTGITDSSAVVTWNTNEPANSIVVAGTLTPPGTNYGDAGVTVTSHSVMLTGLESCVQYYFAVTSTDPSGNSTTNDNFGSYFTFRTKTRRFALSRDDVEQGSGVFVVSGTGSTWHIDTCRASSPTHAWKAGAPQGTCPGQYQNNTDTYLTSPAIALGPAGHGYHLRFKEWYQFAPFGDSGEVQASTNGGSTWSTVASDFVDSFGWLESDYDLSSFTGNVILRFWFHSDILNTSEGWYIDDIEVSSVNSCGMEFTSYSITDSCSFGGIGDNDGILDPGESAVLQVTATNQELVDLTNISATIDTTLPGVTIQDDTATFPNTVAGGTSTSNPPNFAFSVDSTVPCNTLVPISIDFSSTQGSWSDAFSVAVGTGTENCNTCVTPDFDMVCLPNDLAQVPGGTIDSTCTITSHGSYSGNVTFSCTGAPANVSCSFAPPSATPPPNGSVDSVMTLTLAPNATPGDYTFQVHATDGVLSHDVSISLTIFTFIMHCDSSSFTLMQGDSATTMCTAFRINGYDGPVDLSCSGQPAGVSCDFVPNPIIPPGTTTQLTLSTAPATVPGVYNFAVRGSHAGRISDFNVQLTVNAAPDFSLSCNPSTINGLPGETPTSTCSVASAAGFSSPVNLSCNNLPAGVSCAFNPNPATPPPDGSVDSQLTVTIDSSAAPGDYMFDVAGESGSIHSIPISLTINVPCLFCDDFEDGILASNWTYLKPAWVETGGALVGTPTGKPALAVATPVFAGCSACNFETSFETDGGSHNKLFIYGWYADKKNTLVLLVKQESGKFVLKHLVGGVTAGKIKAALPGGIMPGQFYDVRITFDGITFTLFVDGNSLGTLNATGTPFGTIGFAVKNTSGRLGFINVN